MTKMYGDHDHILSKLRELAAVCGSNKNDSAKVLISACIYEQIRTGSDIIKMLCRVGYKPQHIGAILHHNTGSNPKRSLWTRDETGAYCNTEY